MTDSPGQLSARSTWVEISLGFAGGLAVLLAGNLLAGLGGFVAQNEGALTAAYFLVVPVLVLRRRRADPAVFGIHGVLLIP